MLVILEGLSVPIQLEYKSSISYGSLKSDVLRSRQIDLREFSVYLSGRLILTDDNLIQAGSESGGVTVLRVQTKVLGGKGGFGSQLKAIGAQIQKTTSREACRDLSGRRVRDVKAEKAFGEMAREEKRRAEERQQQKQRRRERRWAQRVVPPKLEDPVYYRSLEDNTDNVNAALKHAHNVNGNRPREAARTGVMRPVFRGMDDLSASDSEQEEEKSSATNSTDSIPPVLSVEQILHAPLPSDMPEELALNQHDAEINSETDMSLDQALDKPPASDTGNESASDQNVNEVLNSDAIIPQILNPAPNANEPELIDLEAVSTREELERFELGSLKLTLTSLGLKCGGTLQERVTRLYMYKTTPKDQLPTFLFAGRGNARDKKPGQGKPV